MIVVFPCDPLRPRRVDEHFEPEAQAFREAGAQVVLIDHDLLCSGEAAAACAGPAESGEATYRGWMVTSEQYGAMFDELARRGIVLRTDPDSYRRAHELPGWYEALAPATPDAVWSSGADLDAIPDLCAQISSGAAVLRDYVKSAKHYWHEAAYFPDVTDVAACRAVAERFLEIRDSSFTGGFVLRRFETFEGPEARTWWIDGSCRLTTAHPDTPDEIVEGADLTAIAPLVQSLGLPFVTVDVARRSDGVWRVIELGDGQVSDRPTSCAAEVLVAALATR